MRKKELLSSSKNFTDSTAISDADQNDYTILNKSTINLCF